MTDKLQAFFAEAEVEIKHRRRLLWRIYRLYHKAQRNLALREVTRHGIRFNLRRTDFERHILIPRKGKCWEWDLVQYLFTRAHNRQCDVFLDVGANIGYYSLLAAKIGIFGEIHAVEPIPENFRRLTWHIEANDFANGITAHNFAVSDHEGTVQMLNTAAHLSGISRIVEDAEGNDAGMGVKESVTAATLDSLFDFRGRKLAVKMDVEGHEFAALRGAETLFAQNDILLQVEVWDENVGVIEYMLSKGFKLIYFKGADFYFERKAD